MNRPTQDQASASPPAVRICHLTSHHAPDDDRIFHKEARTLARAGYEVGIVAPARQRMPAGSAGIQFKLFPANRNYLSRLLHLFELYRLARDFQPQVCLCHEPDALAVGVFLKWRHGSALIYDSHELWSGVIAQRLPRWLAGPAAWIFTRLERALLRRCDAAFGATGAITDRLAAIVGRARTRTLLNVPAEEVFDPVPPGERTTDAFVLCHDGTLTFDRGLKTIVEAVHRLSQKHNVVLKIVGDVFHHEQVWLEDYVRQHGLESVIRRTGWLPYEKVLAALADGHLGLVAFSRKPNHVIAAPNKIFNYLLAGLPFVGPDFMVELQRMAAEDGCCLLADCDSAPELAAAVEAVMLAPARYQRMAQCAREASRARYRWKFMESRLLEMVRAVTMTPKP